MEITEAMLEAGLEAFLSRCGGSDVSFDAEKNNVIVSEIYLAMAAARDGSDTCDVSVSHERAVAEPAPMCPTDVDAFIKQMRNRGVYHMARLGSHPISIYDWADAEKARWLDWAFTDGCKVTG